MTAPLSHDELIARATGVAEGECWPDRFTLSIDGLRSLCADAALQGKQEAICMFIREQSNPSTLDEQAAALAEAERVGMAFLVCGTHIPADRIVIVSPPAGMGPIAAMRAEKDEARKMLAKVEVLLAQVKEAKESDQFLANRVRRMCNLCSIPIPEGDDPFIASVAGTLLGSCCFKLSKFQEDMTRLQQQSFDAINSLKVSLASTPPVQYVPHAWPAHTPAPGPLAEPVGIDTTDPVQASIVASLPPDSPLLKPITDEPEPGVCTSCGVCGALFTGAGLFCPAHS